MTGTVGTLAFTFASRREGDLMQERQLFLKFVLLNAVASVFLVALGLVYGGRVHGPSLVAVPVILLLALYAQIGAGRICWEADNLMGASFGTRAEGPKQRARLLHDAKYLGHWAWCAQVTGILSTVLGFWMLLSAGGGTEDLHTRILTGGGVALVGTFVGTAVSMLLVQTERLIEHELGG